jgi:hypothetical protein
MENRSRFQADFLAELTRKRWVRLAVLAVKLSC